MKNNTRHVYGLIITLFILGTCIFLYRHFILEVPLTDTETINSWMVESNLRFNADNNTPIKASFTIPYLPPHFAILDEYFVSHSYGVTTNLNGYNRKPFWSIRRGRGPQSLYYRAIFRQTDSNDTALPKPTVIKSQPLDDSQKSAVETITMQVRQHHGYSNLCPSTIKELNKKDGNAKLLIGNAFDDEQVINAAILILNQSKIFALPVKGIYLSKQSKTELNSLLAVFNGRIGFILIHALVVQVYLKSFLFGSMVMVLCLMWLAGVKRSFHSPYPLHLLML